LPISSQRYRSVQNISRKGPLNRRSLGFAPDDKGRAMLPSRAVVLESGCLGGRELRFQSGEGKSSAGQIGLQLLYIFKQGGMKSNGFRAGDVLLQVIDE
jgi:hypothetical protein